jgi:hypothetical protein
MNSRHERNGAIRTRGSGQSIVTTGRFAHIPVRVYDIIGIREHTS